mmetsp:Transcript_28297/g.91380  ORF Transcript_28297/g.91380 Transcript_28297/m.91380 type:complete len:221 (+) Transcript_28297:51-713(+)
MYILVYANDYLMAHDADTLLLLFRPQPPTGSRGPRGQTRPPAAAARTPMPICPWLCSCTSASSSWPLLTTVHARESPARVDSPERPYLLAHQKDSPLHHTPAQCHFAPHMGAPTQAPRHSSTWPHCCIALGADSCALASVACSSARSCLVKCSSSSSSSQPSCHMVGSSTSSSPSAHSCSSNSSNSSSSSRRSLWISTAGGFSAFLSAMRSGSVRGAVWR